MDILPNFGRDVVVKEIDSNHLTNITKNMGIATVSASEIAVITTTTLQNRQNLEKITANTPVYVPARACGGVLGAGWSSKGATGTATEDRNDLVDRTGRIGDGSGVSKLLRGYTPGRTIVETVDKSREKQRIHEDGLMDAWASSRVCQAVVVVEVLSSGGGFEDGSGVRRFSREEGEVPEKGRRFGDVA
ncbi:hypothetical protein F5876DRAFT_70819 [Lentinula aff. lateritia]|uniref:Uncharacterized protein n=1 Tax=Lentinula aff. lateritia TaxID=2804960 RepID=A0ACC1THL2_9AGAR|nr:hypothetical protein F5876DRAFT_70819 [Lentinula aff. lateritia]